MTYMSDRIKRNERTANQSDDVWLGAVDGYKNTSCKEDVYGYSKDISCR